MMIKALPFSGSTSRSGNLYLDVAPLMAIQTPSRIGLNTSTMVKRWRLLNWLTTVEDPNGNLRMDVLAQTPVTVRSATTLVDFWIARILGRTINSEDRKSYYRFHGPGA